MKSCSSVLISRTNCAMHWGVPRHQDRKSSDLSPTDKIRMKLCWAIFGYLLTYQSSAILCISGCLQAVLTNRFYGRYEALEGEAGMATPELLAKACGPTAKYIKSYQLVGINFLLLLAREGVEGSILADEMGLGKTAQTICFLGKLAHPVVSACYCNNKWLPLTVL